MRFNLPFLGRGVGGDDVGPPAGGVDTLPTSEAVPGSAATPAVETKQVPAAPDAIETAPSTTAGPDGPDIDEIKNQMVDEESAAGVKKADAVTIVWTRTSLVLAYGFIFLNYFVNSLQSQTTGNLIPYLLSDFYSHSLIPTISIAAYIMAGVLKLPIAKMIDTWGRPHGFALMTGIATLGLVLMAAGRTVETLAAAQVFFSVGFSGFSYCLDVMVADTSSLRNRALAYGFASSPYIATTWAGPALAERFLNDSTIQWAFGTFAILTPVVALPIWLVLYANEHKALRLGVLEPREKSGRGVLGSLAHYAVEFDAAGVFLLAAGLTLFLLPFSLAGSNGVEWSTPWIIAMIVLGVLLVAAFALYERFVAPKPFLPFHLLLSRNVAGSAVLSASLFVSYYCWDGYYTSYLQVVHGLTVAQAGYVANIYSIGACFWAVVVGYLVRVTDRYKWLALVALPVDMLGGGLMIHFRRPDTPIGYVVMCQVFIAVGGGTLVITLQQAAMAVARHGDIAAILAVLYLASSIGSGIGSAVSGAIWQNTLPRELERLLPDEAKAGAADIYASLEMQLSYPPGDPVRDAIVAAYGEAQRRMCIAGAGVFIVAIVSVLVWKDTRLSTVKQNKGRVF